MGPLRALLFIFASGAMLTALHAQSRLDTLMGRYHPPCTAIGLNARSLLSDLIDHGRNDSVELILNYWTSHCGGSSAAGMVNMLLDIEVGRFTDSSYDAQTVLRASRRGQLAQMSGREVSSLPLTADEFSFELYREFPFIMRPFDESIRHWGCRLSYTQPPGLAHDICQNLCTGSDSLINTLNRQAYPETRLQRALTDPVKSRTTDVAVGHFSLWAGAWIPTGRLSTIGNRPEFGVRLGARHRRMNYDLTLGFKVGPSDEPYIAKHTRGDNTLDTTSHFFGGHIGIDVGWALVPWKKHHELQLVGGVGWDGFDAFNDQNGDSDQNASAGSVDLSSGLEYRYFGKKRNYWGIQVKYHLVDYSRNEVVDLPGQPITIRLLWGIVGAGYRQWWTY